MVAVTYGVARVTAPKNAGKRASGSRKNLVTRFVTAMMEARLIVATIPQRCRLSMEPGQNVVPRQLVTLRPKEHVEMRVHIRATPRHIEAI